MADDVTFNRVPAETLKRWKLVRQACEESEKLRELLPTLNAADTSEANRARNAAYRDRAVFYGVTGFTLLGLLGLAFRKDPIVDGSVFTDRMASLPYNVDGANTTIFQQAQQTLSNVLQVGRHGLLADIEGAGDTAVIKAYTAENILNWRTDQTNAGERLVMLVLREDYERENQYSIETAERFREYRLIEGQCIMTLWERDKDGALQQVEQRIIRGRGREAAFIPFVFIGSMTNGPEIDGAPLHRLAMVNVAHYRNSADYEDSVFFVGQAQPYIAGLTEDWRDWLAGKDENGVARMYWGSRMPILLPQGGDAGMVQPSPNTLVREAMDQKEAQMVALGARLIQGGVGARTADQSRGEREASTSVLAICCANVSEAYQAVIRMAGVLVDKTIVTDTDTFLINQEFVEQAADPATMAQLVGMWQSGVIAKRDILDWLRSRGAIDPERTDDDIEGDVEAEGPQLSTVGVDDGDGERAASK